MERRREPRLPAAQMVGVTILAPEEAAQDRRIDAELTEISGKGARLRTCEPMEIGAAVRIDVDDSVLLGEVCHCSRIERGYLCGVEVDQILSHVRDLTHLMEALLGERTEEPSQEKVLKLRRRR